MDFIDKITAISKKIPLQREHIQTEEATKNAFVMPFIDALGYNLFNPMEVVPEFVADVGSKKYEKVDYALLRDGQPVILFECKWCGADLDKAHAAQLSRYFAFTEARFGILTNGIVYRFFSDLDKPNKMDAKPFFEFDMLDFTETQVEELKKFSKPRFDLDGIMATASELKYTREIRRVMANEFASPSDEFVRFFAKRVYSGPLFAGVRERFIVFTAKAAKQFTNELVSDRLKIALGGGAEPPVVDGEELIADPGERAKRKVSTTQEELEGYFAVKLIARSVVDSKRIVIRDTLSYCGILFDDNNRQPICRLHFNREQKYLVIFDDQKKETRVAIESVDDIFNYSDQITAIVTHYSATK
jgi:hypothetical protein